MIRASIVERNLASPFELPSGGPNFYEFDDDVLYSLHIANQGRAAADITYDFRFETRIGNPDTFLYNTGPIASLDDPHFNKRQFYSVTRTVGGVATEAAGRRDRVRRPAGGRLLRRPRCRLRPR